MYKIPDRKAHPSPHQEQLARRLDEKGRGSPISIHDLPLPLLQIRNEWLVRAISAKH